MNKEIDFDDKRVVALIKYGVVFVLITATLTVLNLYVYNKAKLLVNDASANVNNIDSIKSLTKSIEEKNQEYTKLAEEADSLLIKQNINKGDILTQFNEAAANNNVKIKKFAQSQNEITENLKDIDKQGFLITFSGSLPNIVNVLNKLNKEEKFQITLLDLKNEGLSSSSSSSTDFTEEKPVIDTLNSQPLGRDVIDFNFSTSSKMTIGITYISGKGAAGLEEI